MKLMVNGDPRELSGPATIAQLVAALELPARAILVEHNGVALRRDEWPACFLQENDRIEFIRIVAGG